MRLVTSGAVRALAVKEWRIAKTYPLQLFGRYPLGLLSIVTFYFISQLIGASTVRLGDFDATYFEFVVVGLLVGDFSVAASRAFMSTIGSEQSGKTLELLLGSPVSRTSLLVGLSITPFFLTLGDLAIYLVVALGLMASGFSLTGLLALIPVLLLVWIVFGAVGVFSAGMTVVTKRGDPIVILVTYVSNLLAGTLFPVALLPGPLQALSLLIPTRYALDAGRLVLLGDESVMAILPHLGVLSVAALVLVPLSVAFFNWSVDTARTTGTLATS